MTDDTKIDRYSLPGHDRDCLRAMWAQAGHGVTPLSQVQVQHLLMIAWSAGAAAERDGEIVAVPPVGYVHFEERRFPRRRRWWRWWR